MIESIRLMAIIRAVGSLRCAIAETLVSEGITGIGEVSLE